LRRRILLRQTDRTGDELLVYRVEAGTAGDIILLQVVSWVDEVVPLADVYLVILIGAGDRVVTARAGLGSFP
jgi:hypothetical protein